MLNTFSAWANISSHRRQRSRFHTLAAAQGAFFIATGLWPILHMRSFEAVTGPKTDKWLVKTLGGLIAATGSAMALGATERARTLPVLGAGAALALGAADLVYVAKKRISPVYLLDALVEASLVGAWLAAARRSIR